MKNPRLYIKGEIHVNQILELDKTASHYLGAVLRVKVQKRIKVFNGQGGYFQCEVRFVNKKNVSLAVLEYFNENNESNLNTHIGLAMSLGDRMEYAIQKACELGVNEITPLVTVRSELKLKGEKQQKKMLRWQQVAISSCEQNGRNIVPIIHTPELFDHFIRNKEHDCKLVLHHRQAQDIKAMPEPKNVCALIGPEGGLTQDEINQARVHKFVPITLGQRVLRTETAPVVLLSVLQTLWGDF